jgi:uncharacterized RDD family membrane protein YckC
MYINSPYEVPEEVIASHGQRIANYLLDQLFQVILLFCILVGLVFIAALTQTDGIMHWIRNMGFFHQYLLGIVIAIIYYGISETLMGRTIGKFISGTIIVMEDGSLPDSDVILKRTFCRLIPFEWITFFGTPCRGWHDSIPGVYVVDKKLFDASIRKFRENNKAQTVEITEQ